MSDDKTKTGKADRIRINVHQDHEMAYWSRKLECPREKLVEAVGVVGPMVKDVAQYLGIWHLVLEGDVVGELESLVASQPRAPTTDVEVEYLPQHDAKTKKTR